MYLTFAISIIVTLSFGIWGIYTLFRNRYFGEIIYIKEQIILLFDTIVKNLPALSVQYDNYPVNPNLVLIRGALVNSGKKDISPQMIESPITLTLENDNKWLEAKVISTSKNVQASIKFIDEKTLQINSGLFRCNEFIRFQALAEVPIEENKSEKDKQKLLNEKLEKELKFTHRIQDTKKIKKTELKEDYLLSKRFKRFLIVPILGLLFTIGFITIFTIKGSPGTFCYNLNTEKYGYIQVKIVPLDNNTVKVKAVNHDYKTTLELEDFFKKCRGHPIITPNILEPIIIITTTFIVYVFLPSLLILIKYREYRFNKKFLHMIELK